MCMEAGGGGASRLPTSPPLLLTLSSNLLSSPVPSGSHPHLPTSPSSPTLPMSHERTRRSPLPDTGWPFVLSLIQRLAGLAPAPAVRAAHADVAMVAAASTSVPPGPSTAGAASGAVSGLGSTELRSSVNGEAILLALEYIVTTLSGSPELITVRGSRAIRRAVLTRAFPSQQSSLLPFALHET